VKNFSPPENACLLQAPELVSVGDSYLGRQQRRHGKSGCMAGLGRVAEGGVFWVSGTQSCAFITCQAQPVLSNQGMRPSNQGTLVLLQGRQAQEPYKNILSPSS